MIEFNYVRAHKEWAQPQFDALPDEVKQLFDDVVEIGGELKQSGASPVQFPDTNQGRELRAKFEAIDSETLANASYVIYRYGHWAHTTAAVVHYPNMPPKRFDAVHGDTFEPARSARTYIENLNSYGDPEGEVTTEFIKAGPQDKVGANWKFEHLAKAVVIERGDQHLLQEVDLQRRLNWPECDHPHDKPFHDHKPGSDYSLEEQHHLLNEGLPEGTPFEFYRVIHANHKPHVFMIGPRHMTGDSPVLDPNSAPCVHPTGTDGFGRRGPCGLPYSEHTWDTIAVIKLLRDIDREELEAIKQVEPVMEKYGIDGVAFLETTFAINGTAEEEETPSESA